MNKSFFQIFVVKVDRSAFWEIIDYEQHNFEYWFIILESFIAILYDFEKHSGTWKAYWIKNEEWNLFFMQLFLYTILLAKSI